MVVEEDVFDNSDASQMCSMCSPLCHSKPNLLPKNVCLRYEFYSHLFCNWPLFDRKAWESGVMADTHIMTFWDMHFERERERRVRRTQSVFGGTKCHRLNQRTVKKVFSRVLGMFYNVIRIIGQIERHWKRLRETARETARENRRQTWMRPIVQWLPLLS